MVRAPTQRYTDPMRCTAAAIVSAVGLALGCAGAPKTAPGSEANAAASSEVAKADPKPSAPDAAADASSEPDTGAVYTEPPPQVVRRHHVFASMHARAAKKVLINSVLTTAADEAETLALETPALLEFKAKGAKEWVPIADVLVKNVKLKGSRVAGNERQEIELEITATHPAAAGKGKLNPFVRNSRVRLQIDRSDRAQ